MFSPRHSQYDYFVLSFLVLPANVSGPRWPSGKISASGPESTKEPACIGPVHANSYVGDQTSSRWCGSEVWRVGVPALVSSSSSDRSSKLRGSYQNSPRVASKRDVNIIKLS
ncbi:hypothetical protein AVEN_184268-1 [Araneus ventricosus]|uniref:Uncharacterized protein n=1 Tax=Araneus ventricosus TaxID=182803 RepID=A0A4Y2U7T5_ARAVE|nr:hypothetical protein AVEN_83850-1 [Araneus ventricosus]GBO09098.1 hypothetical protein AVEN_184268-1 [Araneus ventricosus]